jgi:uncharacterized membrane protein YdcZ (DUF606 family)
MSEALYIVLSFAVGFGAAFQIGMLGKLQDERGTFEASWVSMLGSLGALTVTMVVLGLTKIDPPSLPSPFNKTLVFALVCLVAAAALAISVRGVHPSLAMTGLFGFFYVLSAAFLAPRIGVGLFLATSTAGTLVGGLGMDHYGAFGTQVIRIDALKVAGLAFLMLGVVLIKGR